MYTGKTFLHIDVITVWTWRSSPAFLTEQCMSIQSHFPGSVPPFSIWRNPLPPEGPAIMSPPLKAHHGPYRTEVILPNGLKSSFLTLCSRCQWLNLNSSFYPDILIIMGVPCKVCVVSATHTHQALSMILGQACAGRVWVLLRTGPVSSFHILSTSINCRPTIDLLCQAWARPWAGNRGKGRCGPLVDSECSGA